MLSESPLRRHIMAHMYSYARVSRWVLFTCVTVLSLLGVVMLYSTTARSGEGMLKKQLMWIAVGLVGAFVAYLIDYRKLCKHRRILILGAAVPLLYLAAAHGLYQFDIGNVPGVPEINGAHRWLRFGGFSLQPSEFAKLAVIIFTAGFYGSNPRFSQSIRKWILPMSGIAVVGLLILSGGSLSVTGITATVVTGMLFVAGVRLRWFGVLAGIAVVGVACVLWLSPSRMNRVTKYRHPELYQQNETYQLWRSQLAIGSGHFTGAGFNGSRMKESYLPEAHTDFIMAIVGEELGFVTIASVLLLYVLLTLAAFCIAMAAPDAQGTLLGFGIGLMFWLGAYINLGVVCGILPTTGISAPFVSYGGSGLLGSWIAIGILLNIASNSHVSEEEEELDQSPARGAGRSTVTGRMLA
ncbi:MAG: cell division protein FtsW [Rhodothermales bacterium]|jgi:cell division protein FtsW